MALFIYGWNLGVNVMAFVGLCFVVQSVLPVVLSKVFGDEN